MEESGEFLHEECNVDIDYLGYQICECLQKVNESVEEINKIFIEFICRLQKKIIIEENYNYSDVCSDCSKPKNMKYYDCKSDNCYLKFHVNKWVSFRY